MKNIVYIAKNSYKATLYFYKNESGVYSVMMGLLSVVLVGLIAFAVDGSGLLLDKARFVQGMEQASLALVAENNANRQNKSHYDVTRQQSDKSDANAKSEEQQDKRNQELIRGIVQSYYLGNTYRPNPKDNNSDIKDEYHYKCGPIDNGSNGISKTVACEVSGNFDRPSWFYLKDQALSFDKTEKISSGAIYAQKNQDDVAPLDLMLVSDFSGSMNYDVETNSVKDSSKSKLKALKEVVASISEDLLDSKKAENDNRNISPFNRIGFTAFSFGAQQKDRSGYCYLPFYFKNNLAASLSPHLTKSSKTNSDYKEIIKYMNDSVDLDKTINLVDSNSFNGKDFSDRDFISYTKSAFCLGSSSNTTTNFWYGKDQHTTLKNTFSALDAAGATLSSSGLLMGANYLMDKNTNPEASPATLKTNTQRILIVLSDGKDELSKELNPILVTPKLIAKGLCDKIRAKLDSLQDKNYTTRPARIAFVAFGYPPDGEQKTGWQNCVGEKGYYLASSKEELLETFRQIVGLNEEVGHALDSKPNFYQNKK
ncbi:TadE/TadG family type IV pilus assembly protein [Lonepinella sp. MS14436]|uniref:TadE/TadG family type IV pilus assembly protein n=1 Tax=Lonepinella sp. MS14436 TaxID=3003619 RepID=UPI0036D9A6DC